MLNMLLRIREMFYYLKKKIKISKVKNAQFKTQCKKTNTTTGNYAAVISHNIDARLRSRNLTVSVKSETVDTWLHETHSSRDANMKESRLFMYILNNSDILFRFGQISVCKCLLRGINTSYFILFYLILFFVPFMVNKKHGKQNRKKCTRLQMIERKCKLLRLFKDQT